QIYGLLSPADLLNLSRASKDIYKRLKDDKSVWRLARKNVEDLPGLPPWLSERAYAALCFDRFCSRCLDTRKPHKVLWEYGVRYCVAC
ncbi:hypothetical protein C8Q78DRAFT_985695, partial [Trametes maxima]